VKERTPSFRGRSVARAETFDCNREARQELALSVAGVMVAMLIWSSMMLLFH